MSFSITPSMRKEMENCLKPKSKKKKRPKTTAPTPTPQQRILQKKLNKLARESLRLQENNAERQKFNRANDRTHFGDIQVEHKKIYLEIESIKEKIKQLSS